MNEKINDILLEYHTKIGDFTKPFNTYFNIERWFEITNKILNVVNIKDLSIEPNISPIDKLKTLRYKHTSNNWQYGNVFLNDYYKDKVCQNIKCLTFNSFYPNLLIKLADNNIIQFENEKYFLLFKYLYYNRDTFKKYDTYILYRILINYFYGVISGESSEYYNRNKIINCKNFENFDIYKYGIFGNILNKLGNDLIYLDTDLFYYKGDYEFNFDLSFEIEDVKQFIIFNKKKYVSVIGNDTKIKGYRILK